MGRLLRFSIGAKLLMAFAMLIAGFGGLLLLSLDRLVALQETEAEQFGQHYHRLSTVQELRVNLAMLQSQLMRALEADAGADLAAIEAAIESGNAANNAITERLQRQAADDDVVRSLVAQLIAERSAVANTRARQLELINAGDIAAARSLNVREQFARLDRIEMLGDQLAAETERRINEALTASQLGLDETRGTMVRLGLMLIVLGCGAAWLLSLHIAQPLARLTALAQQISHGQLPASVPVSGRQDEVGKLTEAFAAMNSYLREMVREINEGIAVLASSSEEILAATSQAASGTQETATAISEIATTIDEVKQTARLASDKSTSVTQSAERTRLVARSGFEAVDDALAGMQQIREQVQAVAESIMRLGDQTQAIGEIVATVGDLAEQSNLLGVNASIEAVKAGEFGKGFSVVAQEVKALADQSKQATAQVRGILADVQKAMTKAVMQAEQGTKAVAAGHERAQAGGEALRTLYTSIEESNEVALQIAATSSQQMVGMDQIADAMEYITQASQDNVGGIRQVDTAARDLHELGLKLKVLAERFRL